LRLAAALPCAWAITEGATTLALSLFLLAIATDYADGPLARRRGEASDFGGLLDHASDALFVSISLGALALRSEVPYLLTPLVLLAFAQYVLDSRALAGRKLRASFLGRWNGIAYFVLAGTAIIRDGLGLDWPGASWVLVGGWLLVMTTLASMLDRGLAGRAG
jgi:phosphatidylglycerophosphate synthase